MPRKGMRSLCCVSTELLSSRDSPSTPSPRLSFHNSEKIDRAIDSAESIICKWNTDASTYARVTSLFYENKSEAMLFIKRVNNLQKAMLVLVSEDSASEKLVRAQRLMEIAMKRLQKEFYQILSMNRALLDPESVSMRSSRASTRSSTSSLEDYDGDYDDGEIRAAGDSITEVEEASSIAMADLRAIAEGMIGSGYAKECVSIYKSIRKSIIDEGIYRLGVEKITPSRVKKMDWEVLDMKIKNWLEAVKISMKTLFNGERILCDHVFGSSNLIRESCFSHISRDGALLLFGFPEIVAKSSKRDPSEKIFRMLDMYTAIADSWQAIEIIFSFESSSTVRSQALNSLIRLGESTRSLFSNFESGIQNSSSKRLVPGGGVHPLAISSMNYLSLLADYNTILSDILNGPPPPDRSSSPESHFDVPDSVESAASNVSIRVAWIIFVLLCKIDVSTKHYKDASLLHLFLANNLRHVISRVRTSNLKCLLGDEWISKHEAKTRQFTENYERLAWNPVVESLPENPTAEISPGEAKRRFQQFNTLFQSAYEKQTAFVVPDPKLRDEIKVSIAKKMMPRYIEFYQKHRLTVMAGVKDARRAKLFVRFAPEDLNNYLSDLFLGRGNSGNSASSSRYSSRS